MTDYPPDDETQTVVSVNSRGVTCTRPGLTEHVDWDAIERIEIVTTDEGPVHEDVWLLLAGREQGCAIPQGSPAFKQLLFDDLKDRFEPLDYKAVTNAMSSAQNARFLVWKNPS